MKVSQYNEAIKLRGNIPYREIAKLMGISEGKVSGWFWGGSKPREISEKWKKHQKKQVKLLQKIRTRILLPQSKKMSYNLAYILGVMLGDGTFGKTETKLMVKDKDFALKFKKALENWSKIPVKLWNSGKYYTVSLCSKKAKQFLINYNIKRVLDYNKKIKIALLRGLFDSEGCIYNIKNKNKVRIEFINTNIRIIKIVLKLLNYLQIEYTIQKRYGKNKKDWFVIIITKKDSIYKFYSQIGFSIKRKQDKLKGYLKNVI